MTREPGTTLWRGMRRAAWAVLLLCAPTLAATAAEADDLVEQLKSDDFEIRRAAAEKLVELGEAARPALERAAVSNDPDLRATAAQLIGASRKATLNLRLFDRVGNAAAGVEVELQVTEDETTALGVRTSDANGKLTFETTPGPTNLRVVLRKWIDDPYGNGYLWGSPLRPGENIAHSIVTRGGVLAGRVLDAEGAPLKDARVLALEDGNPMPPELLDQQITMVETQGPVTVTTGVDGSWKHEALADGVYQIFVRAENRAPAWLGFIRVRADETTTLPDVRLAPRKSGTFRCSLMKTPATPLAKTALQVRFDPVFTGERAPNLRRALKALRYFTEHGAPAMLSKETDANGQLTIDDVPPGTYDVMIKRIPANPFDQGQDPEDSIRQVVRGVVIASGESTDAGKVQLLKPGSISGLVKGPKGVPLKDVRVYAVTEEAVSLIDSEQIESVDLTVQLTGEFFDQINSQQSTSTQGTFEIPRLPPGRYALYFSAADLPPSYLFGIDVVSGARTAAPPLVIPADREIPLLNVRGYIRMNGALPPAGASVTLQVGSNNSWQQVLTETAAFEFDKVWSPTHEHATALIAKAPGSRPQLVDLTLPGVDASALKINLEKAEFGGLRIKVVDAAGQPLARARVRPVARMSDVFDAGSAKVVGYTNRDGIATLQGLATGKRKFKVELDGYFLPKLLVAEVAPDAQTELQAVLSKGIILRGRAVLPEGYPLDRVTITRSDWETGSVLLAPDGTFEMSGLSPGKVSIVGHAPGLSFPPSNVELKDGVAPAPLTITASRVGAFVATLDPRMAGRSVSLVLASHWRPDRKKDGHDGSHMGTVDSTGRLEIWGVPPGKYDALLTNEEYGAGGPVCDVYSPSGTVKASGATSIAGPFDIVEGAKPSELAKTKPVPATFRTGTASVTGRVLNSMKGRTSTMPQGIAAIWVVGRDTRGIASFAFPSDFTPKVRPFLSGPIPKHIEMQEPGVFVICGLPAGEYELLGDLDVENKSTGEYEPALKPTRLATFTLKDGERKDVGALDFLKDVSLAPLAPELQYEHHMEPEDRAPVFQP